jgi:hypothetical protein
LLQEVINNGIDTIIKINDFLFILFPVILLKDKVRINRIKKLETTKLHSEFILMAQRIFKQPI